MTEPQFAAISALLIDLNGFQERIADALERIADTLENPAQSPAEASKVEIPYETPGN